MIWIGLADVGKRHIGLLEFLLEQFHHMIGFGAHRFIHHHLQDQVGAAFQVQAQTDVFLHAAQQAVFFDSGYAPRPVISEENQGGEQHQHCHDKNCFYKNILLHRLNSGLPMQFRLLTCGYLIFPRHRHN